jgi:hypothetical protein
MNNIKQKFVLYTNPNNVTSMAYVAKGARDVNSVLTRAGHYPDSYQILYQGKGSELDMRQAQQLFTHYTFR